VSWAVLFTPKFMSHRDFTWRPIAIPKSFAVLVFSCCLCLGRVSSSPPPLSERSHTFTFTSPQSPALCATPHPLAYTFPLRVSENHRYLVDRRGRPFRIHGDSAQSLIANLTYSEAEIYLADRCSKGFNSVNINLLERKFAVNAPKNRRGDDPFRERDNFAAPNEAYFDFADSIIDLAASRGMLVTLAVMYLGFNGGDQGWWSALTNAVNTQDVCYRLGLYVGRRYKSRANILWVIGGDFTPPPGSEGEKRLHKIMEGIKAAGASQLWAGDWNAPCLSTDVRAFASDMDVNAVYTYGISGHDGLTYAEARAAYNYSPSRPAYLKETGYENEVWLPGDRSSVRKYEYWALLGGATAGIFFGHRDLWDFATASWSSGLAPGHGPWQGALNSPGNLDMMHLGKLLDSVAWYKLVPSGGAGTKKLITAGGGTYGGEDYVTAAAAADGKLFLAYLPPGASTVELVINMGSLAGPVRARWFDPTSGNYIDIAGGAFRNSGSRTFKIPGTNAAGARDWVLLLEVNENSRR
jgi:Protein of unknown function (DUF4038)/Putative collagen-binding domain of a collagenase